MKVALLVFDRAPESLDEHLVHPAALAIHADPDFGPLEDGDEGFTGEPATLVGVEDLRFPVGVDRLLQSFGAEIGRQRVRQPPGEDLSTLPVDDCHQVQEAPGHRDSGHVRRPDPGWGAQCSDPRADTGRSCGHAPALLSAAGVR